ncbi:transglutaminase family protein [Dankookia sp. P2]|uniref:transglutaminase family protein n=1 Tax=Dankookia sp. P2 TaxID=3423955 RepID=UPI003D67691F
MPPRLEATAAETGRKVILEGYLPPRDERLLSFSVTPDPGVIEVNIHPAASWPEMVERTGQLYEEARQTGLSAEKFMLDGRHVGTGGGNHVVMGAASPKDSPFLRRPDLLKSMLGFWHNHPSLSYLFSGLFIGPTSQHPRVDEARQDSLAEARDRLRQDQRRGGDAALDGRPALPQHPGRHDRQHPPDRVLHRQDVCAGEQQRAARAGGVPRAGDAPHPQMAAAQMLLMRSAIAAFWKTPYDRRLVRWGTRLHDEFMLPHYVAQDFGDVLREMADLGFPLAEDWFRAAPRIPLPADRRGDAARRQARTAPRARALARAGRGAGRRRRTVRYVDSSTERLQAKLRGWVEERYALACNGYEVPLTRTETEGEYVAGIRFKAWDPLLRPAPDDPGARRRWSSISTTAGPGGASAG